MEKLVTSLVKLIEATTELVNKKLGEVPYQPPIPFPPPAQVGAGTEEGIKKERKARTPKTVESQTADLGGIPQTGTHAEKKELTEAESVARLDEITKQYVSITKNDTPEDGKTRAVRMLQTDPRFKVGKIGDLNHKQRLEWIAEMEKGIKEHV